MSFFFFNDTATTEIYTLSLHDALPILLQRAPRRGWRCCRCARHGNRNDRAAAHRGGTTGERRALPLPRSDRKSTRLNSSHANIPYAVFCLKKKILLSITKQNPISSRDI